jgi:hypothetical protein
VAAPVPDIDAFEERAAILEYDAGLKRDEAEDLAAQAQGFKDTQHYRQVLADYLLTGKL